MWLISYLSLHYMVLSYNSSIPVSVSTTVPVVSINKVSSLSGSFTAH